MRATDRTGLAVTAAVALASLTAGPLSRDESYLGTAWFLMAALTVLTMGLRRLQLGVGTVLAAQLATVVLSTVVLASLLSGPDAGPFGRVTLLWGRGIAHMQQTAAPMPANDGVDLIFVTVILALWVICDLLVVGLERPAWGLAPLATVFAVSAIGLSTDSGLGSFLCVAVGYLVILVADGLNTSARWTRGLSRDSADGFGTATPVVWRAAGYIGVPAVILTLLFGVALPTLSLPGFGFGNGSGGSGSLQLVDPTLDLRRNLNQPSDRTVIRYTTSQRGGHYLRMASLPELTDAGWGQVPMSLSEQQPLPAIPGLELEEPEPRTTTIEVLDFGSDYLPLPYAPRSFTAPGEWAYDPNSLIVLSNGSRFTRNDAIRNLTYEVESVDIAPNADRFSAVGAGTPSDGTVTDVIPADLPQSIRTLTDQVTATAQTDAGRAAAIQAFLRGRDFTYSTQTLPGTGFGALENFLLRDRRGYCEQFAAAMAAMARVVGIPSRVAVGFLPGQRTGDVWEVSIRDMHAWPELYFEDYGWVRFEPTPAIVTDAAPDWTVPQAVSPSTGPSASASADPSSSAAPGGGPTEAPEQTPTDGGADAGATWPRTLGMVAGGLALLALLAAPATIRVRRRASRLDGEGAIEEQVEEVWAEIRDTVVDYGGAWPAGSPQQIGSEVATRLEPEESRSMSQVATLVERSRYARTVLDPNTNGSGAADGLTTMATGIRRGIAGPVSVRRKILATVLPKSLFRRRGW